MKISKKSKSLALIILFIVVSTLAYGIGTIRGFLHGSELNRIQNDLVTVSITLSMLESYHSGNNEFLEQLLDSNLDSHIKFLLLPAKHEKDIKLPVDVGIFIKIITPEYPIQVKDILKKILTSAAEYRRDNPGVYLYPSDENYSLLMTYLPKDSVNHIKD